MKCNREEFYVTYPVELFGKIEQLRRIETRRKNIPGLRKPYEYIAPAEKVKETIKELRKIIKTYEDKRSIRSCSHVKQKAISRGTELTVFLLPECHNGHSERIYDCDADIWEKIADDIQEKLFDLLGPDAKLYFVPMTLKEPGIDIQIRWSGYIMYDELKSL